MFILDYVNVIGKVDFKEVSLFGARVELVNMSALKPEEGYVIFESACEDRIVGYDCRNLKMLV